MADLLSGDSGVMVGKKKRLSEIEIGDLGLAQHAALNRLHLKLTGDTHELLLGLLAKLQAALVAYVIDEAGTINPLAGGPLADFINTAWRETFNRWQRRFEAARREAALLAFAGLARQHKYFMGLMSSAPDSPLGEGRFLEQGPVGVKAEPFFKPQLREILGATEKRVYSDGFRLSRRIWNLDEQSMAGIQQIVTETLATGNSAWNAAKRLEQYLGAGRDCPRWTGTRLFKLTKTDIAQGDKRGLIGGSPCASKGVAYNALRLARNEIQIVHAAATDAMFARQPWVEAEKVNLSPSHPPIGCACEDIVAGGEKGDGVYSKGTIALPVHVQCLCFKTAVLMDEGEFVGRLRNWMDGSGGWPEMDGYAAWLRATRGTITAILAGDLYEQLALPLMTWLNGNEDEVERRLDSAED